MERPKDEARKTHSKNHKIIHGKWPGEEKQFFLSYDVHGNTLPRTYWQVQRVQLSLAIHYLLMKLFRNPRADTGVALSG